MGGLVLNESGIQVFLNYGPLITGPRRLLHAYGTGAVLTAVESLRARSPKQAEQWRGKLNFLLHDWPNTFSKPESRPVGWVHEANMAIDSDLFRRIGGFDPSLRYHETQELSMQLKHLGLQRMFMPEVSVTQKAIDVRGKSRRLQEVSAALRLLMRYTLHTHPRYNRGHGETTEGPD